MTITELGYALDTLFILLSAALVMWMAAGFSMLEAGLVRTKNTTEILVKNILLYALACLCYLFIGYHLMYGQAETTDYSSNAFLFFQMVFVATAMSIVSGAVAERMKLSMFLVFTVVLTSIIYPLVGNWTWGGGFLNAMGFTDFAGSGVVHMAGASAALAGVIILGPRKGKYGHSGAIYPIPGANMPLAALGTLILWFGWLGFNGGSLLSIHNAENADTVANIFLNTNLSAASGAVCAFIITRLVWRKADLTMILNGVLAGLVAITAEPAAATTISSVLIGGGAGAIVVISIVLLDRLKIDDPVGAISVHGIAGLYGLLCASFTSATATLSIQLLGAVIIFLWVFITSLVLWWLLARAFGIRLEMEHEYIGADISECGVEAYPEFVASKSR
ncbi:ammonium transporter [Pseudidiomarina marina]|uniref:Ammonium transporter n=1 Tax=Pseudidiomarina marina TaxID=502366 RepID=A0A432YD59_9GAMM|nr:ammonium transporter [Pseudidiomarina marina]PHR65777.1 MAG: ammonium transporter [Idiomarina sp.]RUO58871.1 ammonium transporter [Pseudidiomarina marina]